ncbi:MAG: hypothetical protein ACYC63_16855 [Armatimonadota bacterium]
MRDANLGAMLRDEVWVERPEVTVVEGNPTTPRYVREAAARRGLVQPLTGKLAAELIGKLPESTHVVYLEEAVEAADVLVCEGVRYEALSCEDEGGQGHHWRVVVRLSTSFR